jgi:hypothetical protein
VTNVWYEERCISVIRFDELWGANGRSEERRDSVVKYGKLWAKNGRSEGRQDSIVRYGELWATNGRSKERCDSVVRYGKLQATNVRYKERSVSVVRFDKLRAANGRSKERRDFVVRYGKLWATNGRSEERRDSVLGYGELWAENGRFEKRRASVVRFTKFLRRPAITVNIAPPLAMMMNVPPPQSGPSGTLRVVQTAGAVPLPPSGIRNDALPLFGSMNVVRQMANTRKVTFPKFGKLNFMRTSITVNIAPPTNNVAPPLSGTTSVIRTACAAPPLPSTTIMNVDPHQSGWTRVVQTIATMNFADLPSGTKKLVMTDNSMMHSDSDTLPVGKSNARRK